ncbi:histone-lysine N-methyltransferase CLF-like [Rutidosis leptorrhynchoides]|uniref:histone-lysine N-methyltransferase CLF-like n=1 Tax=Rutidosis leptorrhynchoides TaxID=125765 RepID=UPI003A99AD74
MGMNLVRNSGLNVVFRIIGDVFEASDWCCDFRGMGFGLVWSIIYFEGCQDATALQDETANLAQISVVIDSLKKEVEADRSGYIMKRMAGNRIKQAVCTGNHLRLAEQRGNNNGDKPVNLLSQRMKEAIDMKNGVDVRSSWVTILGPNIPFMNNLIRHIDLPKVEKLPPFTAWAFLDRNQKMTEDQSVVGRRRIYYDQNGSETLVCSDSEEDEIDEEKEEDKKQFVDSEDNFIRFTFEQLGPFDIVFDLLAQQLSRKPFEVKARYEAISNKGKDVESSFLDKNLEVAQDTFDNLFCRRCFIFDCKLHGCSQELIFPADKPTWNGINEENIPCSQRCSLRVQKLEGNDKLTKSEFGNSNNNRQITDFESWQTLEKDLFRKGLDIYGQNSCLIARNLMAPLKTCVEVNHVLMNYENNQAFQEGKGDSVDDSSKIETNDNMCTTFIRRSILRKRNRFRRFKYSLKSAGLHHSLRKRFFDRNNLSCHQYNPCGCQSICRNDCSCFLNGNTCEKYCGCPKSCKNRFRGCFCAKSQCRSRECPCFAANRECDPDLCRNCWIGCGDGTLGSPDPKGDTYKCKNVNLLLRRQHRILQGKSDVSGWGAFLKDSVAKDEYLGEYTGELISHHEADKRGKIYDRENSSFLFNLNDEYVLDAYRKGNKLKFANHSLNPNCYAKVMMVAGDHRVGIYAKENISAGEELFYDYRYEHDKAPARAKKTEDSASKKEDVASTSGRPKKIA